MTELSKCPCDSCRFKRMNSTVGGKCPNFKYFFDAFMRALDGKLKTNVCEKWEWEGENDERVH